MIFLFGEFTQLVNHCELFFVANLINILVHHTFNLSYSSCQTYFFEKKFLIAPNDVID